MATNTKTASPEVFSQSRVARNAAIYFFGQIFTWLINIVTISIIPRALGETAMGQFAFAMTTASTVQTLLTLGGDNFLTKEVGRDRNLSAQLLSGLFGLRIFLIPLLALITYLTFYVLKADAVTWQLGHLLIIACVVALFADPLRAVLLGWEEAKQITLLDTVFVLIPLLTIPFLRYGIITQAIATVLSYCIVFAFRYQWIQRHIAIRPAFHFDLWNTLVRGGLPFLVNNLMLQLSAFIALAILRHQADIDAVGVYSQARRLFGTFLFIPTAIGMALLPSLARLAEVGEAEFRQLQSRVLILLMVLALPITTTVMVLARPISHLLYGAHAFQDMPAVLQMYALAILPMYVVTAMYQFLVAQNRGGTWTRFLIASIGIYSLIAWFLVPYTEHTFRSGAIGAVLATCFSELLSVVFAFILLQNNPLNAETLSRLFRALVATLGMVAVMRLTQNLFLLIPVVLGFITFALLAWVLRVLTPEEQQKVTALIRRAFRMPAR
ncbi:MAG: oligosaccharide flippase family protein [Chloroherpetonaceae bacterium]|nr:oligosaccharide flippase family protein [Chthonomonadaceae bacterium]MDW8208266.1 oligosaccharide flippase family protein [Chloroherpetonaceae bacterium]